MTSLPEGFGRHDEEPEGPLSFGQDVMYEVAGPEARNRTLQAAFAIKGPLDVAAFAGAVRTVVERRQALRVRIGRAADGTPWQTVHRAGDGPLFARQAVQCRSEEQFAYYATRLRTAGMRQPWDLEREPPFRFRLLRYSPEHHAFLADFPQLALDACGRSLFVGELWQSYRDLVTGRSGSDPVAGDDLISAVRQQRERQVHRSAAVAGAYWQAKCGKLARVRERLRGDPAEPLRQQLVRTLRVDGRRLDTVRQECEAARVSLFQRLLARFAVEMCRLRPGPELELGCMTDTREVSGRQLMGRFSLSLPLLLPAVLTDGEALAQLRAELMRTMRHRHISGADFRRAAAGQPQVPPRGAVTARLLEHSASNDLNRLSETGLTVEPGAYSPRAAASTGIDLAVHDHGSRVDVVLRLDSRDFAPPDADAVARGLDQLLRSSVPRK
ncbi:condensation domain-containing protein [Streptomyces sp. GbtcB6]|uniref:condensation domain-containing protein n=1 Tax=Streptomyces sp. GbtcB6 TaxID=2824751 RepID=UPI001C2FF75F|nr:condensation domain-containing protein [Streptomyces sp. GbtcB6]